ncbi:MAG TPA: LamG domain-containing protein [Archaeoglobaceae archaeon]|nr:LamG domain-containing protein [Archaeoglobaceae archaeon]
MYSVISKREKRQKNNLLIAVLVIILLITVASAYEITGNIKGKIVSPTDNDVFLKIISPQSKKYTSRLISLNFTSNYESKSCILSVDSVNQSIECVNQSVISSEYESLPSSLWFHFNGDLTDSSGNENTVYTSGVEFVEGKFSYSLYFDGKGFIEVSNSPILDGSNEITIELWVKPVLGKRSSLVNKYVYDYSIPINERVYELDITPDGYIQFALSSDGTTNSTVWLKSAKKIPNNTWTHIAATSDGEIMKIYINGKQDENTADAPEIIHTSPFNLYIGAWRYSLTDMDCYFTGYIDELRIINRCLTDDEIESDYALGNGEHSITLSTKVGNRWESVTVNFSVEK